MDRARVGVAVRDLATGALFTTGELQSGNAWSTIKIPLVLARYRLAHSRDENALEQVTTLATQAITASDNAAAAALFVSLSDALGGIDAASLYLQKELAVSGDSTTQINTVDPGRGFSTYGQTQWSLDQGTRFFRSLAQQCIPPRAENDRILNLMAEIQSDQRWGIGHAQWPGAAFVRFKGGWGPDATGHYLVRQFGIVEDAEHRGFVVGLLAEGSDGTFAGGVAELDALARAVAAATRVDRAMMARHCVG